MSNVAPYVLLIDDDVDISDAIKAILIDEGYHISCVYNGKEALDFLNQAAVIPSLILLDIMMPKMNGYEFRKEQLKNDKLSKIPTVVFSAAGKFDDEESYKFTETIKKPLDLERLLAIVSTHLR